MVYKWEEDGQDTFSGSIALMRDMLGGTALNLTLQFFVENKCGRGFPHPILGSRP